MLRTSKVRKGASDVDVALLVWPHRLALYNVAPLEVKAQVVHEGIANAAACDATPSPEYRACVRYVAVVRLALPSGEKAWLVGTAGGSLRVHDHATLVPRGKCISLEMPDGAELTALTVPVAKLNNNSSNNNSKGADDAVAVAPSRLGRDTKAPCKVVIAGFSDGTVTSHPLDEIVARIGA